ncbi:MAG: phosphotransferase [Pseudomonadota bacterium]
MPDIRKQQAKTWAARRLDWSTVNFEPASADASFRRYFRIVEDSNPKQESLILMDSPSEHEPLAAFIDIAERLSKAGLNVPKVHAADQELGFALLDDLGYQPYHHVLNEDNAKDLFSDALDALITMQVKTDISGLPEYDAALLFSELQLFPDWFLAKHWKVEPTEAELDDWEMICITLIRWALDQPQVFCHRDFMPRNLMNTTPNPGVLDFQDAVLGPISYDPVCLFRDAFLSWPTERVDQWLEDYRQRALKASLPVTESAELWRRTCDMIGVQRHLKVLGIFARIRYRDGKPHYLEDAARFFGYLDTAIARNPELQLLGQLIQCWHKRSNQVGD